MIFVSAPSDDLWDKYIEKLLVVNDENQTERYHTYMASKLDGWKAGILEMGGPFLNGDLYYLHLEETEGVKPRPMCCGEFLDWKSKLESER